MERDILVVLREELDAAREMLAEVALYGPAERAPYAALAEELEKWAHHLDSRIHGPFDGVLLNRTATSFRQAHAALQKQLEARAEAKRHSPLTTHLVHRLAACAKSVLGVARHGQSPELADAMSPLLDEAGWAGAPLDSVVRLADVVTLLAHKRLGDDLAKDKLESLLNRAVSTVVVSALHGISDAVKRSGHPASALRDRYGLTRALDMPTRTVTVRLGEWFGLDPIQSQPMLFPAIDEVMRALIERVSS